MAKDGAPYIGFLYAGLMIDDEGNPKVIEFIATLVILRRSHCITRLQSDLLQAAPGCGSRYTC